MYLYYPLSLCAAYILFIYDSYDHDDYRIIIEVAQQE